MASPLMRVRPPVPIDAAERRRKAAARLLAVERSEEIFPVLLEEILALGFPRALVARVDFETGEIKPAAALNCPRGYLQKFRTSVYATENPVVRVLHSLKPELVPSLGKLGGSVFCHPLVYRNNTLCWEAERDSRSECLAVENFQCLRKLNLQEQVCGICDMRAYAAIAVVDLPPREEQSQLEDLGSLIDLANRYLSRLFNVEHYYNRMSDMEITIAQMQTVMQSMADPVILTDAQHRVIMQNKAAERFFKLSDEVSEGRVRAVELNNLLFSAALSSMAVSGSDSSRDLTLVDAIEGEEVLFEAVCAPSFSRDGRRTGMVTVMRDVTDLRRADQELRANYEKLRNAEEVVRQDRDRLNLIIENVGDPIVVCDKDAKPVLLDPLALELLRAEAAVAVDPVRVRNQARFDAYITAFTFSFSDRQNATIMLHNPTQKQEVEYDARSGKIYDERGQVAFTVTVLRDLTAYKRLEQLKMERRMLEMEKFAVSGRLAGTIAHEVNNPMEAIKNCIYLMNEGVKNDFVPVYNILKNETERVARIVRQMLGLYRNTEQVGNIEINSIIEDTLMLFSRQLERAGVKVTPDLGKLPNVMGNADQIRQLVSNLVVNAKDSMSSGGVLRLRTRLLANNNGTRDWVRLSIADSGCGISRDMLGSIFEPFVTTKGERGTGLGLWIVKGIVENHGGKLKVRSKQNAGTVFRIDLPVIRQ